MTFSLRSRPLVLVIAGLAVIATAVVYAQLEGGDRGIPPIESSTTIEVTSVDVDVTAKNGDEARLQGWREAQAKAWKVLWAKTTGNPIGQAPSLPDSELDGLVASIAVEQEQFSAHRYIARLTVLFDRGKVGEKLGIGGIARRSAPMLVIPVMLTGSSYESFEVKNAWQRAWATFRTGTSAIDYVRPAGNGVDPVLLNQAQTGRPGRSWWRMLLDQYGASDIVIPEVRLARAYPGGPTLGTFNARYGADNQLLGSFTLRAGNSASIPAMLEEGVRRLDQIYTHALDVGLLSPDSSLTAQGPSIVDQLAAKIEAATAATQAEAAPPPQAAAAPVPVGATTMFTLQVETPTAAAVSQAELAVSRIPGVTSAITTSLALGGTSLMRVTFSGDPAALTAALTARGWTVAGSGATLRITRPAGGGG